MGQSYYNSWGPLKPMNTFRVNFDDGDHLVTGFRGTLEEAQAYYVGKSFEKRDETMHKGVSVEQIH